MVIDTATLAGVRRSATMEMFLYATCLAIAIATNELFVCAIGLGFALGDSVRRAQTASRLLEQKGLR